MSSDYQAQPPTKDNKHPTNGLTYDPSTNKYLTGRPSKYHPDLCNKLLEHFAIPPEDPTTNKANDLPTQEGFCCQIGITSETFGEWCHSYPEFSSAWKKAQEHQRHIWQTNSLKGRYNTPFTIFMGKNVFGWSDRQDVNVTVSIEDKIRQIDSRSEPEAIEATVVDDDATHK